MADVPQETEETTVKLKPILERGDGKKVTKVVIRKPTTAQVSKVEGGRISVLQMIDTANADLLQRVSTPMITPKMYAELPISESGKFITALREFFAPDDDEMIINDDGTVTIIIPVGLLKDEQDNDITTLTVNEPNVHKISKAGGRLMLLSMQDKNIAKLLAGTTSPKITPQQYMALPIDQNQKLINAIIYFLDSSSSEEMFEV